MTARRTRLVVLLVLSGALLLLPRPAPAAVSADVVAAVAGIQGQGFSVVGGRPAAATELTAVVALVRRDGPGAGVADPVGAQFCGGTMIAPDLVLTAAHCLHDDAVTDWTTTGELLVVAGRVDLGDRSVGHEVGVSEVYLHPAYDPRRRRYDAAVLRLDRPLDTGGDEEASGRGDVGLQQLAAAGGAGPFREDVLETVGWGRTLTSTSGTTAVLQRAQVVLATDADCRSAYEGTLDLKAHVCAGGAGTSEAPATDACRGDSGGPLLASEASETSGEMVQHGITSFGPSDCGVGEPGVYTRVSTIRPFLDEVIAGQRPPSTLPEGTGADDDVVTGRTDPVRVADLEADTTTPIGQAIAVSRATFADRTAELAVVARDDAFPDALAGSSLGYGRGPLLFTGSDGPLTDATRTELLRAVEPGSVVFLLGGVLAIPSSVEDALRADGFDVVRLAGRTREATAVAVADEVIERHGNGTRPPFGTVIVATSGAWPDAVVAGQLGVWWGYPVLLTGPEALHEDVTALLDRSAVDRVLVIGGESAVSGQAVLQIARHAPSAAVIRLSGPGRVATADTVAAWHLDELRRRGEAPPDAAVAVNLREDRGFAHVLSATPLIGATAGVFVPVEGQDGSQILDSTRSTFCGLGARPVVAGGTDLITDAVAEVLADTMAGIGCTSRSR